MFYKNISKMYHVVIDTSLNGEGLDWLKRSSVLEEQEVSQEEAKFHCEVKQLFYPDTKFMAPGMDRKNSEEEEEDIDSYESSEEEAEEIHNVRLFE